MAMELEVEEMIELGEYLGDKDKFCTDCAKMPCECLLTYLELKLQILKSSSGGAEDAGGKDAGHQHQYLNEADAQHRTEGQLHHPQHQGDEVAPNGAKASRKRKAGGQLHHQWGDGAAHQKHPKKKKKFLPDDDEKAGGMMDDERGLHQHHEEPLHHH